MNEPRGGCVSCQPSHFWGHHFMTLRFCSLTSDLVLFLCFATFSFDLSQFKMWFSRSIDSLTLWTSVLLTILLSKEWIYVRACWSVTSSADERLCHSLCLVFSYALGPGSPAFRLTWGSARGLSLLCLVSPVNIWEAFSFRIPLFQLASPVSFPFILNATNSYPWFLCAQSASFKKTQQVKIWISKADQLEVEELLIFQREFKSPKLYHSIGWH